MKIGLSNTCTTHEVDLSVLSVQDLKVIRFQLIQEIVTQFVTEHHSNELNGRLWRLNKEIEKRK